MKTLLIILGCVTLNLLLFAGFIMLVASDNQPNLLSQLNTAGLHGRSVAIEAPLRAASELGARLKETARALTPAMLAAPHGRIDPNLDELTVTGYGAMPATGDYSIPQAQLMAVKAAQIDGMAKLAILLAGAKVDSEAASDLNVLREFIVSEQVEARIRGARTVETRYLPDGTVEVDLALKI